MFKANDKIMLLYSENFRSNVANNHTHTHTHIYIHIYIERERESKREREGTKPEN